jgi:ectoine hydroxylase-related dioxygenase (phytanoyl-CoA dioxygenase family)
VSAIEGMTAAVRRVPADATIDEIHAILQADGCVVVERLVSGEVMDAVRSELAPHLDGVAFGCDEFTGHSTKRIGSLLERSPTVRELAIHPTVIGALDRVLAGRGAGYQLHLTQVIDIWPGQGAQMVHRDQWAFDFFPFPAGFEVECHTMWALSDFTEQNGATRVIPTSNHWEDGLRPGVERTVPAEMPRGSVMLYVGSLYHGGGENRADERRLGINIGYTLSWLRQEENQYLACDPGVARTFPEELLRLMGYARGAYALGYVGDLHDPLDVLLGRTGATAGATFAAER